MMGYRLLCRDNCFNGIANFNTQLRCCVAIHHRHDQITGASEQGNHFTDWSFTKSIHHPFDLNTV